MPRPKISRAAARAVLAEIQRVADETTLENPDSLLVHQNLLARLVLYRIIDSIEGFVPQDERGKTDVFRLRNKLADW